MIHKLRSQNRRGKAPLPMILGGAAVVVVLVIFLVIAFSGGQDEGPTFATGSGGSTEIERRGPGGTRERGDRPGNRIDLSTSGEQPGSQASASGVAGGPQTRAEDEATTTAGAQGQQGPGSRAPGLAAAGQNAPGSGGTGANRGGRSGSNRSGSSNDPDATPDQDATATDEEEKLAIVSGMVRDTENNGIPGIEIDAMGQGSTMSAGGGSYSMEVPAPGRIMLRVVVPPDANWAGGQAQFLDVAAGGTYDNVNFTLSKGEELVGIVVDENDSPVGQVMVAAFFGGDAKGVYTQSDGRFVMGGVPESGQVDMLSATKEGYVPVERRNVSVLEGEQRLVLYRGQEVTLTTLWASDETPVEQYSYRLLKRNQNTGQWDNARRATGVRASNGQTTIDDQAPGEYRVEVTVLDESGMPTDLRAAQDFLVSPGGSGEDVEVLVGTGAILLGQVLMEGSGVAGATVLVESDSSSSNAPRGFEPQEVTSGAGGSFQVLGLPTGRFLLNATQGTNTTEDPEIVVVSTGEEPAPVTLELVPGARVSGTVYNQDGEPEQGATVSLRESQQSPNLQEASTSADGSYRIIGLAPRDLYLVARLRNGETDARQIRPQAGQDLVQDFDFSGAITVNVTVYVNGEPGNSSIRLLNLLGESSGAMKDQVRVQPDGTFTERLQPEAYTVTGHENSELQGTLGRIIVQPEPQEQEHQLNIDMAAADVIVVFPADTRFQEGKLILRPRNATTAADTVRREINQSPRRFTALVAGEYQATYTSNDGEWSGTSEWTPVMPGGENVLTLEARKTTGGVRIGGWSSGMVDPSQARTFSYDVSSEVESAGLVQVTVRHEGGSDSVEPSAVYLLQNGSVVAQDEHLGRAGSDTYNNVYRLDLYQYQPNASYSVEIRMRGDGGSDSQGSFYLSLN